MTTNHKFEENRRTTGSSKDGDWICSDSECKNSNFARRNKCNRCGRERVHLQGFEKCHNSSSSSNMESVPHTGSKKKVGIEIGKVAAEKSRGLFSAEDWQCSKCANVNWARRHTCNLCNAPRFCEVEERTGYGGGYNDRGTVEYKEREESDDEYDEFGRRRKKRKISNDGLNKSTNEGSPEIPRKKTFHSTGENDDDDEEDDEDGDLSKYDLWGSDDQELMKDNISHTKRKHSHASPTTSRYSRSRSRSTSPHEKSDRNRSHQPNIRIRSRSRSSQKMECSSSSFRH
ncbi:zinc finger Ran-binding domain-containing protein 2 isoform X2 [Toxorhynchites rutilus septentrionalis]|uniref:zinc finger Ran-binding domain-containing protein 2 isoform X2 n=1 Tax=Toxorhynchites rutilus septentrionalis TaxID=329112 RepID=UPI0024798280|nr:zinc finger Ran-binding domain-containing protein 2 isoform X2 [Toxorhynchites rutilus septentrionalis]